MPKNKNFITRGEQAQREREESYQEYSKAEHEKLRDLRTVGHNIAAAREVGDIATISLNLGKQESILEDLNVLAAPRIEVVETHYRRSVRAALGIRATKEDVARHQYSPSNLGVSIAMSAQPTSVLQDIAESAQSKRYGIQQNILSQSRILSTTSSTMEQKEAAKSSLSTSWRELETEAEREGRAKNALAIQRRKKSDTGSLLESTGHVLLSKEKQRWATEAASGKAGSAADLNKAYDESLQKVTASFNTLNEVLQRAADTEEDITKKKQDTAKAEADLKKDKENYDKAQIQKQAAGGIGGWERGMKGLGDLGVVASMGGSMWRQWNVTQAMDTKHLQTGAMDVTNRRFFDRVAASQGDAAAIARIAGGQHSRSYEFAKEMGKQEIRAAGAEVTGTGLSTAWQLGRAALAGAAIGSFVPVAGTAVGAAVGFGLGALGVLSAGASGIDSTSAQAAKLQSGAVRAGQELDAYRADEALFEAQNKMKNYVNQTALDYNRSSYLSTRGAGGNRAGLLTGLKDMSFVKRMANLEMSPEEISELSQMGVSTLGKGFKRSDIDRAAELTKMGLTGSGQEYLGLRQATDSAGVGSKGLEDVLQKAVAAGLDASKHINELVQGIDSIASSRGGVSTFGGAAENMALTTQALTAGGLLPLQAAAAAADMNKTLSDAAANKGINIENLAEDSRIARIAPGAGFTTRARLRSMKPEEYRTALAAMGTPQEGETLVNLGLQGMNKDQLEQLMQASGEQASARLLGTGQNTTMEKKWQDIFGGKTKGPVVGSPEYDMMLNYWNANAGFKGFTPIKYGAGLNVATGSFDPRAQANRSTVAYRAPGVVDTKAFLRQSTNAFRNLTDDSFGGGADFGLTPSSGVGSRGMSVGEQEDAEMQRLRNSWKSQVKSDRKLGKNQETALTALSAANPNAANDIAKAINSGATDDQISNMFIKYSPSGNDAEASKNRQNLLDAQQLYKTADQEDVGSKQVTAGTVGQATALEKGMVDLAKNVEIMAKAATQIDPQHFKDVIDESGKTLGGTLDALNKSVQGLDGVLKGLTTAIPAAVQKASDRQTGKVGG